MQPRRPQASGRPLRVVAVTAGEATGFHARPAQQKGLLTTDNRVVTMIELQPQMIFGVNLRLR